MNPWGKAKHDACVHERRFPLLIGLRAFRLLAVAPAWLLFVAALSLTVYLVGPDLPYGNVLRLFGYVGLILALCLCLSPFALLFMAGFVFRRLRRAFSARACDIALGREGIRVIGGQAHGFAASWESLAMPGGVRWLGDGLWLRGGEKRWLNVPLPADADEHTSLEAVHATIAAYAAAYAQKNAPKPRRTPPGTLLCHGCGAPQAPVDAPSVQCRHCNAPNPIPKELAEKIRAMRTMAKERAGDDALASAVLAQRSAIAANLVAFLGGLLMLGASGVTLLMTAGFALVDGKETGLPRFGGFGVAAAGVGLILLSAVRFILANRRALRLLSVGFSAREPEREGDPPACRTCAGPLPEPDRGSAISHCVYCGATNVRAADLRLEAAVVEHFSTTAKDPHEVLAACKHQRLRARMVFLLGLAMSTFGVVWVVQEDRALAMIGAKEAFEVPFDENETPQYLGEVLAGPAALRVERDRNVGDKQIWLDPDGTGRVLLVDPEHALAKLPLSKAFFQGTIVMDIAPLPEGAFLATTRASEQGHWRIHRVERSGKAEKLLDDAREPMPSPDGKKLVAARLMGEHFHLVLASANQPEAPLQLTRGQGHEAFPVWSPDGKRIAFLTRTVRDPIHYTKRYGHSHLWVMDADGHHAERLTTGVSLEMVRPVWTEQGIWVLASESTSQGLGKVLWKVVPR